jgi:hypothetical protein
MAQVRLAVPRESHGVAVLTLSHNHKQKTKPISQKNGFIHNKKTRMKQWLLAGEEFFLHHIQVGLKSPPKFLSNRQWGVHFFLRGGGLPLLGCETNHPSRWSITSTLVTCLYSITYEQFPPPGQNKVPDIMHFYLIIYNSDPRKILLFHNIYKLTVSYYCTFQHTHDKAIQNSNGWVHNMWNRQTMSIQLMLHKFLPRRNVSQHLRAKGRGN